MLLRQGQTTEQAERESLMSALQNDYGKHVAAQEAVRNANKQAERHEKNYLETLKRIREKIEEKHCSKETLFGSKMTDDFVLYISANTKVAGNKLWNLNYELFARNVGKLFGMLMTKLYPQMDGTRRLEWGLAIGQIIEGEIRIIRDSRIMEIPGQPIIEDRGKFLLPTSMYNASFLRGGLRKAELPNEPEKGMLGFEEMDAEDDSEVHFSVSEGVKQLIGIPGTRNLVTFYAIGNYREIQNEMMAQWMSLTADTNRNDSVNRRNFEDALVRAVMLPWSH